jgi:aspartyl-tRNA(Asn)/glutamyl-tRNA(Gln) amidotransferase subunit A
VTAEVRRAVTAALDALAAAGWEVREIRPPWLSELSRWEQALAAIVTSEAYRVHRGRDTGKYAAGTRAVLDYGRSVTPAQNARAQADREILKAQVDASLAGVDVLAGPTVGYCAPEHDPPFGTGDDNAEARFTGPYNLTGHPAVSIPVPAAGLPVGLQLAGRHGADFALLRVAAGIERVLAGIREATPPGRPAGALGKE